MMQHGREALIEEDRRLRVIRNSFGPGDYETAVTAAAFQTAATLRLEKIHDESGK